jgi:hypothetical protein
MNPEEAMKIVNALVEGYDPISEEPLPEDAALHNASVMRALLLARGALQANMDRQKRRGMLPPRVGIVWTDEEDQKLIAAWTQRQPIEDIASSHGRTVRAIESRLERLGLITAEQRTSFQFSPTGPAERGGVTE